MAAKGQNETDKKRTETYADGSIIATRKTDMNGHHKTIKNHGEANMK